MSNYDLVPYVARVHGSSHPDPMRALAHLFGVDAPDVRTARILELGCASGTNLMALAASFPEATFVGVDASGVQIGTGKEELEANDITNCELHHVDIREIDESWGTFDYILCHGVFSWVPEDVQDAILRIGKQNLSKNGICYISYNVLPGWYQRMAVRDLMLLHAEGFEDPYKQIQQARAILDFVVEHNVEGKLGYGTALREVQASVSMHDDAYVFHEYLEGNNRPIYFRDFARRAREHGLQYLGESLLSEMMTQNLGKASHELLDQLNDLIRIEQYQDFLRNRTFRTSLLVHEDAPIRRNIEAEHVYDLRFGCRYSVAVDKELDVNDGTNWKFSSGNTTFDTQVPLMKAALLHLARNHPTTQAFEDIFQAARAATGSEEPVDEDRRQLAMAMLSCLAKAFVSIGTVERPRVSWVSPRPVVWPLAREVSERRDFVPTLNHTNVKLRPVTRLLLPLLDGEHGMDDLVDLALLAVEDGRLEAKWMEEEPTDQADRRKAIADVVLKHLGELARQGLLVG